MAPKTKAIMPPDTPEPSVALAEEEPEKEFITVKQAAKMLGLDPRAVYPLLNEGSIVGGRFGTITPKGRRGKIRVEKNSVVRFRDANLIGSGGAN